MSPVGLLVVFTYVFVVIGGGLLFAITISLVAGTGTVVSWPGFIAMVVFLVVWTAAAFRLNRRGLWTSDRGVRCRSVIRTRTIPWADIARFEHSVAPGLTDLLPVRSVSIVLKNGSQVSTDVVFRVQGRTPSRLRDGFLQVSEASTVLPTHTEIATTLRRLNEGLRAHS